MTNLVKKLKNAPKGLVLYSPLFGDVVFEEITTGNYPISCYVIDPFGNKKPEEFTKEGFYFTSYANPEILLFPSYDNRNWESFDVGFIPDVSNVYYYFDEGFNICNKEWEDSKEDQFRCSGKNCFESFAEADELRTILYKSMYR
jgi:hypothetical protein